MKKWLIVLFLIIGFSGCGGGEDSKPTTNNNIENNTSDENSKINLTLKSTYELPYVFGSINQNVILDEDSIIFVGGNKAQPSGAQHDGHPAFSNKAIKIDLITGNKQTLDINASSGHTFDDGTIANGRGNSAKVYKLDNNKYLVYGGFQYENSIEVIDFTSETVKKINAYYLNRVGSVVFNNGDIGFFGVNGNFGGVKISIFSSNDENLTLLDTNLTMARSSTTAHKLADGRIIIIGGWDGSAQVTPDSATRRVEIFNPNDNSIIRVSDYPEPISNGQRTKKAPVENDSICVANYQYTISQDKWESGCTISTNSGNFDSSKYNLPRLIDGSWYSYGGYIGTLSSGDIVYMENGTYSSAFSDDLLGYPVDKPTKIYVFSISN